MAGAQAFGEQMLLARQACTSTFRVRRLACYAQCRPIEISKATMRNVRAKAGLQASSIEALAEKYSEVRVYGI